MKARRRSKHIPPRLVIYGISVAAWTRRYGVVPFSAPCSKCGRQLTTTLPFVQQIEPGRVLHGLTAPTCECGNDHPPYALLLEELPR